MGLPVPVQLLSVLLGKLQHWAGCAHVASLVAGEREIRTDGAEEDAVNPFASLYILTVQQKKMPEEKVDCRDYIF